MPGCERLLLAVFLWAAIVSVIFPGGTWGYRESSASGRVSDFAPRHRSGVRYAVKHRAWFKISRKPDRLLCTSTSGTEHGQGSPRL